MPRSADTVPHVPPARLRASEARPPHIFLHIGAMKTGTTYLQDLFRANATGLGEAGVLYAHDEDVNQNIAVRGMMAAFRHGSDDADDAMWQRLVQRMLDHRGESALLSMEFLSYADSDLAQHVLAAFDPADVTIILTVRDLAATLPGQWQTACRNGGTGKLVAMVRALARLMEEGDAAQGPAVRLLRRTQQISRMLEVWTPLVGPERVHVVTNPGRGRDPRVLWERMASVLNVDPDCCPETEGVSSNPSLGLASTELLRRLNIVLAEDWNPLTAKLEKRYLGHQILSARRAQESSIKLNRRGLRLAASMNQATLDSIHRLGVSLHGSAADLPTSTEVEGAPKAIPLPSDEELLAAAETAAAGLSAMQARLEHEGATLGSTITSTPPDSTTTSPVERALTELAQRLAACSELAEQVPDFEDVLDELFT